MSPGGEGVTTNKFCPHFVVIAVTKSRDIASFLIFTQGWGYHTGRKSRILICDEFQAYSETCCVSPF